MTEPICPACNGVGTMQVAMKCEDCNVAIFRHESCPTCYGAGIATDDEVKEFINYMKEE